VEVHGGHIAVGVARTGGARFVVTLPMASPAFQISAHDSIPS
jgi:hypothetical protein